MDNVTINRKEFQSLMGNLLYVVEVEGMVVAMPVDLATDVRGMTTAEGEGLVTAVPEMTTREVVDLVTAVPEMTTREVVDLLVETEMGVVLVVNLVMVAAVGLITDPEMVVALVGSREMAAVGLTTGREMEEAMVDLVEGREMAAEGSEVNLGTVEVVLVADKEMETEGDNPEMEDLGEEEILEVEGDLVVLVEDLVEVVDQVWNLL